MDVETFLDAYGLIAIFGIMLVKSVGVPIPIPADVLMLATSARVATGKLALPWTFVALLVALAVGGVVQYVLVRRLGRGLICQYGRYLGITPARIDAASHRMEKGGAVGVGVAVLTPGVRSVAVIACALAGIPMSLFVPGLVIGSAVFLGLHFILGYVGGSLLNTLGTAVSLPAVIVIVVGLLLLSFVAWYLIRRRQRPHATVRECLADAAGSWHEAVCPVCLCLGAMDRLQITLPVETERQGGRNGA